MGATGNAKEDLAISVMAMNAHILESNIIAKLCWNKQASAVVLQCTNFKVVLMITREDLIDVSQACPS